MIPMSVILDSLEGMAFINDSNQELDNETVWSSLRYQTNQYSFGRTFDDTEMHFLPNPVRKRPRKNTLLWNYHQKDFSSGEF